MKGPTRECKIRAQRGKESNISQYQPALAIDPHGGSQNQHIQVSAPPNCRRTARLSQRILPALGYITTLKPEQYREIELVIHAKPKKKAASRDSAIASLYFLHSMTFGKRQSTDQPSKNISPSGEVQAQLQFGNRFWYPVKIRRCAGGHSAISSTISREWSQRRRQNGDASRSPWSPWSVVSALHALRRSPKVPASESPRHYKWQLPSGNLTKSYWKWPFIVSFPINSMVIFHSYVNVYQRLP